MEKAFYTKEHFWASIENDIITIGLTDYLLDNFDIINFIDLPQIGTIFAKTELLGSITYDEDRNFEILAPFSGEIIEVNNLLIDNPDQLLNNDKDINWLFRIYNDSQEDLEILMSEEEYKEFIDEL